MNQPVLLRHVLVLGALAGTLLAGCGGASAADGTPVTVAALDTMHYSPATIDAKVGETLAITFKNSAQATAHDFITDGAAKNARLVNVGPGKQQTTTFMATKPGTYQFYCSQPGHKEAGMLGTIVVR